MKKEKKTPQGAGSLLQVPKPNMTRYGKNSVKYFAAITWNKISDTVKIPKYIVFF